MVNRGSTSDDGVAGGTIPVTLADVAKAAGVSSSTVSRALSRPDLVGSETRQKVLAAVVDLGYTPNRSAAALSTGRTGLIGMAVSSLDNPIYGPLIRGVQKRAADYGADLVVVDTQELSEGELRLLKRLARQCDGVLSSGSRLERTQLAHFAEDHRIVLLNRRVRSVPSVALDYAAGMATLAEHLGELGHTKLTVVTGPPDSWGDGERRRGVRRRATELGIHVETFGPVRPDFAAGVLAADAALQNGSTGLLTYNSLIALGALYQLAVHRVSVPDHFSVASSDRIAASGIAHPVLTGLDAQVEEMGQAAAQLLLDPPSDAADQTLTIRQTFVAGETTGHSNRR